MGFDEAFVRRYFNASDYERGRQYFRAGRVKDLKEEVDGKKTVYTCQVQGTRVYDVTFSLTEKDGKMKADMDCTCPRFRDRGSCKHLAAAMLAAAWEREDRSRKLMEYAFMDIPKKTPDTAARSGKEKRGRTDPNRSSATDSAARGILNAYLDAEKSAPAPRARLEPRLYPELNQGEYPMLSLSVGESRMYVVKDVEEFLNNVANKKTVPYGKNLTLYHGIENFDAPSRELIELLMDCSGKFRPVTAQSTYYIYNYNNYNYLYSSAGVYGKKSQVKLTDAYFDRLFDVLRRFPNMTGNGTDRGCPLLEEGDPSVTVTLTPKKEGARLQIKTPEEIVFFGSRQYLYASIGSRILRCGGAFRERVFPLLRERTPSLSISEEDMPAFCGYVLPKLRGLVTLEDPKEITEKYLPDECVPLFRFDLDDEGALTLDVRFRYNETETASGRTPVGKAGPKRDLPAERNAMEFARQALPEEDGEGHFRLTGDDQVYDFMTSGMEGFFERGEVFVSDRLRGRNIRPKPAAVGVSVSGGTLLLDLDTGDFPVSELEALYQSLTKKRRYHRLRDGRYLTLDGSSYETLAEMAHMLRLTDRELKSGHVELPVYRGLYIDNVLSEREDVHFDRDARFRAMVREFKSLSESDYAVPEEMAGVLRPYQKLGFQWLKTLESCGFGGILADEMGLGKTLQMIAFFLTARRETKGLSNLVVCPASLILNWMDEIGRFAPGLSAVAVMGTAAERKRILENAEGADVIVTSYELLRQDIELYAEREFYCCALDEGQHIKNASTLVSKAVKRIRCRQRFIMTGTPMENRLSELWNLFDFLMPGYLYSHSAFVEKLEKPAVKSGDAAALEKLRRLVQPFMLRRVKKDVLRELPPVIEHVRRVALTEEERKVYLATAAQIRSSLDGGGKLQVLAALTRLRQICCDPALCFENYEGASSKLEACLELCAGMTENGHQILLFSQFTSMLDRIRPRLEAMGITSFTLQGSTPKETRAELVRRFNAGGAQVFLISLKAGGTGLNLTAADVVIHYDPWWNVAAQDQATGRAHRIGQTANVQVYKLIAQNTVEERILTLQEKKAELMSAVASDAQGDILSMSREDLLELLG